MKELTIGIKTNQEIADWMGISCGTFRNKKDDYLNKLSYFAKFKTEKGKIIIEEVFDPIFSKDKFKPAKEIMDKVPEYWDKSGFDTASRCGDRIQADYIKNDPNGKIATLSENTVRQYAGKGREKYFGSPYLGTEGELGHCTFQWGKLVNNRLVELTPEEIKIKDDAYKMIFGDAQEREVIIMEGLASGKITPEQVGYEYQKMAEYHKNKGSFGTFLKVAKEKLGFQLIRGTKIFEEDDQFTFPIVEDKNSSQPAIQDFSFD